MNATYDLTGIISRNAIEDPPLWFALINNQLGGWLIVSFVAIFGITLWVVQRNMGVEDSEAVLYSGIITTIIAILLFVAQVTAMPDVKMLTWSQVIPFFVITCVAIVVNHVRRKY